MHGVIPQPGQFVIKAEDGDGAALHIQGSDVVSHQRALDGDSAPGKHFGGDVGGPVFSSVMGAALRMMSVPPDAPVAPAPDPDDIRRVQMRHGGSEG